jgi:hypothetical protein
MEVLLTRFTAPATPLDAWNKRMSITDAAVLATADEWKQKRPKNSTRRQRLNAGF